MSSHHCIKLFPFWTKELQTFNFSLFIIFSKPYLPSDFLQVCIYLFIYLLNLCYVINTAQSSAHILLGSKRKNYFKSQTHDRGVYTSRDTPSFTELLSRQMFSSLLCATPTVPACRSHLVLVLMEVNPEMHHFFNWPWISGGLMLPSSVYLFCWMFS